MFSHDFCARMLWCTLGACTLAERIKIASYRHSCFCFAGRSFFISECQTAACPACCANLQLQAEQYASRRHLVCRLVL